MYGYISEVNGGAHTCVINIKTFLDLLEATPDELRLDPESILPVAVIAGIVQTLKQNGIDPEAIARATQAIVLAGPQSQIRVNNTNILPFQPPGRYPGYVALGTPRRIEIGFRIGKNYDPHTSATNVVTDLEPGDFCWVKSTPFSRRPGWREDQHNLYGFVLGTYSPVQDPGDKLVFTHGPVVDKRISTLGGLFLELCRKLGEIGVPTTELSRIKVAGTGVDYEELYNLFRDGVNNL
jgi:hypothetical protein